ncbi:MAG: RagB/SusD family nutrient uptake outer membrane protein [Dysgonomonas sp.]|nr:RagB/SusD family nutrient uptake outer membrane protein [Dysgonomonas sp.]
MKMIKQYINKAIILSLSICMISLNSCSDYLDVSPNDQPQAENIYKSPKQAEQGILGVYSGLRQLSNELYLYMSECRSDNAWVEPIPDAFREYAEIGTFRATYDVKVFNDTWNRLYKVIYDANVALEKIPNIEFTNETLKNQLLGEAYFLRGWSYFELVRLFGNVPLIDKPMSPAEVNTVKQSSAQEIYDKIILPDLKYAEDNLPVTSDMKTSNNESAAAQGRADKIAAKAMLGRVYMTMSGYPLQNSSAQDLAETKLKEVIDFADQNNKFWAPDSTEWKKQWLSEYNNKYSIFAIQYRTGDTGNPAVFNFTPALPPTYTTIRIYGNSIFVEKTLMYEFSKVHSNGKLDARGIGTTVLNGYEAEPNYPAYSNTTENVNIEGVGEVEVYSKSMIYKYTNTLRKRAELGYTSSFESEMKDYNDWPVNYPVIRLEDVMLMYAEVLANKHGNVTEALNIVNKIRTRAGCDLATAGSPEEALKVIKKERRIELCGEGVRWFDMIRWGEWQQNIINMFDRYNNPTGTEVSNVKTGRYLYPIPKTAMITTPGLYNQNADY